MKKNVIVLGLGRFGTAVAKKLYEKNVEVMAVDINYNKVQKIADNVTSAVQADMTDEEAMEELGISNFDVAVIGTGTNLEASIEASLICKDAGVQTIIAKATSETHARILEKIGVDKITYPELDTGNRLANIISGSNILEMLKFSSEFTLVELKARKKWIGKSLRDLDLRDKYEVNVVAFKRDDQIIFTPGPDEKIQEDDNLLIIAKTENLSELEDKD
ncbi:potassium channel family protein [Peptoniphilus obesi]|uniref:potassium channel family protein n=1 Tax=Peptoniphilus obesi TaxID=1472765 RepID=UPI0004B9B152|nr:TrkA family potassium uptake protein [Peptoniphilus obesi]